MGLQPDAGQRSYRQSLNKQLIWTAGFYSYLLRTKANDPGVFMEPVFRNKDTQLNAEGGGGLSLTYGVLFITDSNLNLQFK